MRGNRVPGLLVALCAASLSFAAPASASKVIAPPGNAGVGQYVEVVPGAGGSAPVGAHSSHGPVLTAAQRQRLEASGSSGKALAAFVQQTGVTHSKVSPGVSPKGGQPGKSGVRGAVQGSGKASAPSSLPATARDSATRPAGGGGLGWGLYAALGAIALAAAGVALARRRAA